MDELDFSTLEQQAPERFCSLVRNAIWSGTLTHINNERTAKGLPPLRRPPHKQISSWEQTILDRIDNVILSIDQTTGNHGTRTVTWVDKQLFFIKQDLSNYFTSRDHD
jgi:hypothetical protein